MNKFHFRYFLIVPLVCVLSACYGQSEIENKNSKKKKAASPPSQVATPPPSVEKKAAPQQNVADRTATKVKTKGDDKPDTLQGPFQRLEYEAIQITFKEKKYTILIIDPEKAEIGLFLSGKKSMPSEMEHLAEVTSKEGKILRMAMNAGMFDPALKPLGLFVNSGNTPFPINLNTGLHGNFYELTPNGVFAIDSNNVAYIVESTKFASKFDKIKIKIATQSGPMLVIDRKFNKWFNDGSTNLNIRNGVGVTPDNCVIFAISDDKVNFHEFSELMRDFLSCDNALYLDGFVSHMYFPEFKRSLANKYPLGPILTITEKAK